MFCFCLVETDACRPHLEWLPGETLGAARRNERRLPDQLRKLTATHIYADDERLDIFAGQAGSLQSTGRSRLPE